jgi:hypothetical protein
MRVESPCWYYGSTFDAEDTIRRHAYPVPAQADRLINFLGVKIAAEIYPDYIQGRLGEVEGVPIPGNWHADIAEWSAAMRAVELSGATFRMIELGCGWGCWLNNCGTAAKRMGKSVELIGIEGDAGHLAFAERALSDNGFVRPEYQLVGGIAAASSGYALFPSAGQSGQHWGLEPLFLKDSAERDAALASGRYDELPMLGLGDLTATVDRIDLLHIDIQGGEADLIDESIDTLDAKFATILIGTHSREIEGRLMTTLMGRGWKLEMEKPAMLALDQDGPRVTMDGVQFWRNPRLI